MLLNYIDPLTGVFGEWMSSLSIYSIVLRIFIALTVAGIIGCERASKRHSAGLRTFMVFSLSMTAAMLIDMSLETASFPVVSAAAVIAGALITVNSILYSSKNQIKGLTTAAALWGVGIISLCFGAGLYTVGLILSVVFIIVLSQFGRIETFLKNRSNHFEIHLELDKSADLKEFIAISRRLGLRIDDVEINPAYVNTGLSVYTISLTVENPELKKYKTHKEIIEALSSVEYVKYIEELSL